MSDTNGPKKNGASTLVGICLLALPFLYVLGIGPAIYCHRRSPPPVQSVIEMAYAPLEWGIEFAPAWVEAGLRRYASLFE